MTKICNTTVFKSPFQKVNCNLAYLTKLKLKPIEKIVNEYDQEIPQSQTADNPVAP